MNRFEFADLKESRSPVLGKICRLLVLAVLLTSTDLAAGRRCLQGCPSERRTGQRRSKFSLPGSCSGKARGCQCQGRRGMGHGLQRLRDDRINPGQMRAKGFPETADIQL